MTTKPLSSDATAAATPGRPSWSTNFSRGFTRNAALQVLVCAALLALRKPWALHTPQFWAEDGEIFMKQDDASGFAAFLIPYNGYLHTLPRLIAWLARISADVAWWPAIYNWFSFGITVAVFARLASRRVELPAKPWLMLALVLVVGSGEVLLNATNLQWHVALLLLLQLFTAPAATLTQRLGDTALLAAIGLNGPFALVFLPFFAWRAWRVRNSDTWRDAGTVAVCAGVQAWFVAQAPLLLPITDGIRPFDLSNLLTVLGNRLAIWPLLGRAALPAMPSWLSVALGVPLMLLLLGAALRASSHRAFRRTLVAVVVIMVSASVYRARLDTWNPIDPIIGDRYFHIPRVLLAWLLILECQAASAPVRWMARSACALGLLANSPQFMFPAPIDYRWAEHCDPIRRGEPANIHTLPEGWFIEYTGRPPRK